MKQILLQNILDSGTLETRDILIRIVSAAIISVVIYISYWYTHVGTSYSKKFNVSLMTLTILTATVMTVIANNLTLSLGMVGALSIVRYRTAIKDSRDTTYIFWSIVIGICCGAGDYLVAGIGSAVVFIVLMLLGRIRNENRILLIIRGSRSEELAAEGIVNEYFDSKALMKVKNTTEVSFEIIYEMSRKVYHLSESKPKSITDRLYDLKNIEYVNIVTQSDEITG